MTLKSEPIFEPRLPGQQPDVAPGSPLAITALFTEIVRQRFTQANALAWVWREVESPATAETGNEDGPRLLQIEPAFSQQVETRNYRPAIFVDKGETVMEKVVLGNMAGKRLRDGLTGYYALATIPIDIEVVSDKKGESATVADIVWFYMLAGREQIRETFGLHEMTPPILGRTVPGEKDKTEWSTHVNFNVQAHLRWSTRPVAPLLKEIVLRFKQSGEPNPDVFLLEKYIR